MTSIESRPPSTAAPAAARGWSRYARWLHLQWPAGTVEPFPDVDEDGGTGTPGLFVIGDLSGIPLLKFALDSGARAIDRIARELPPGKPAPDALDLVIVGGGVSGMAAALEARARGMRFEVVETTEPFFTIVNFPKRKPIYTYPSDMVPAGRLQVHADIKEDLLAELRAQVDGAGIVARHDTARRVRRRRGTLEVELENGEPLRARTVLIAIGRSGAFRTLGVPGEELDKVYHRLHDPRDFAGRRALVVGGGDSALETAIALALAGGIVTLSHRGAELTRPKPELVEKLGRLARDPRADVVIERSSSELIAPAAGPFMGSSRGSGALEIRLASRVERIEESAVVLAGEDGARERIANDVVFTVIGRDPPLRFLADSGIPIRGRIGARSWAALGAFLLFAIWLYDWKSGGAMSALWYRRHWFPTDLADRLSAAGGWIAAAAADRRTVLGTLAISASAPSFWYTLAYSLVVVVFGVRRILRRRVPYVTAQTLTLMSIQVLPLFLLPELILPWLDARGWLPRGLADALFPAVSYGHGREFWRAYGLILAWPLDVYNLFTHQPLPWWIAISVAQTLVLIPLGIYFFGKGFYCGWICSCGALAETLGDRHRHKMPHGPRWNRLNLAGQILLAIAVLLLGIRVAGWLGPSGNVVERVFEGTLAGGYKWIVDVTLAGVIGYGAYFWFSGRVWCRFFCPLAAWMNVVTRFSGFRILADKKKCISCGLCTS